MLLRPLIRNWPINFQYVVLNLPSDQINRLADLPAAKSMLLFDVATVDDALRNEQCRSNVLHILPSRAMRADALAQYMMKKRWIKVVSGHWTYSGRSFICRCYQASCQAFRHGNSGRKNLGAYL